MGDDLRDEQLNISVSGQDNCPVRVGVIGDSLGDPSYGGYVPYLQDALERAGTSATIIDRARGGATSGYGPGAARSLVAMDNPPQIVVLELGGNNLRLGHDPQIVKSDLQETISILKDNSIQVVLSGMVAPQNLPSEYRSIMSPEDYEVYRDTFNAIYPDLAADNGIILDPFIYESVLPIREDGTRGPFPSAGYVQEDRVHFRPRGAERTAEGLVPEIQEAASRLPEMPCP